MGNLSDIQWETGVPLTFGEREGRKKTALVRASVRIAIFRQQKGATECLFVSHPVKGFEVPGGAIDPDEDPLTAALRELHEEAGLTIDATDTRVHLAGFVPITDETNGRWLDIVYVAEISEAVAERLEESAAELPVAWLNVENLDQHLSSNAKKIIDCATKQDES